MKELDIKTESLDYIPDGETFLTGEGQTVILGPVFCEGELKITGHYIVT